MSYTVFGASRQNSKIGAQGPRGFQGIKGEKGEIGPKGDKGDIGQTGDKGDIGPKGDVGARGEKGDIGQQGEKGDKGDIGPRGIQGENGDKGEAGPTGPKGDKGDIGPRGEKGPELSDVLILQDEQTFSFKFIKNDDTSIVTDALSLPFSDNMILQDKVYIVDIEIIPGVNQYSIKYHKSDGTYKILEPMLLSESNIFPRKKNSAMKILGL
jgi:Collagen triple helix repeat (20 copies)